MGRRSYIYAQSSASSDSDSESSSSPAPPRRYRKRRTPTPRHSSQSPAASPGPSPPSPAPPVGAPEGKIETPSLHSSTGTSSTSDDKKKKKSNKPPQESIDKIWERFSQKKFSKALSVLPFTKVPASTSGERGNELLSAGFERAAEECRRKVRKIIAECKRVNTRYRDPGWDLDWDFKWEKGHCLNSLGRTKFEICHSNLIKPSSNIPKAVKRVNDIYEKPTFMANILPGDIKQGSLGNCWFVASLTGLANVQDGIKRVCVEYDTKIGIYGFVFYRDGEWIYSIIDDKLYLRSPCWDSQSMQRELLQQIDREDVERVYRQTYQTGSKALFFAQNKDQNETWVPLMEKAYAKAHGDFACLSGGWIGEALEDLSGGVTTELLASDIFDTDAFWDNELSKVNQEFLFGCATGLLDAGYGDRDGVLEGHAYVLMEARTLKDGTRLCKLRNPWGKIKKGNWEGAWSDGSKEWTTEVQQELNHTFGSDSTFWISYEDLLRKYQHFDRTRLFRDPDWRSCQRWIGVEVTWKPQYHEKFHIKLTKESPLVLVLSQLDTRYFRGLQGQYNFRLQFRVHEEGKPGAEEYVVRSHGNYLMDRSVSIELPSLEPGSYVVYISVIGERNTRLPSTEEVIKRECKGREENEKLAQVGQAYDLAHSKAAGHLQRLAKVRKQAESKKASESRKKERRKNWKQRQTGRDINKKQKVKDDAKKSALKASKKAKAEAEEQAKADAEAKVKAEVEAKAEAEAKAAENASTSSSTTSSSTGTPQYTPQDTPKPEHAEPAAPAVVSGGPPDTTTLPTIPEQKPLEVKVHCCHGSCNTPPKAEETDYSSDSPVEDYEELYDSDDMTPTLRMAGTAATTANDADSDDDDLPEPWNAIAVIGFRVYSKDEDLELRVIMEGGELEQDGMGNLGEADLDNAVSNAAGQRERKKREEKAKKQAEEAALAAAAPTDGNDDASNAASGGTAKTNDTDCPDDTSENGMASYRTIIERKTSEFDRVMGKVQAPAQTQSSTAVDDSSKPQEPSAEKAASPVASTTTITTTTTEAAPQPATKPAEEAKTPSSGAATHVVPPHAWPTTKQKMVLHIRHRLQKGMVSRWGHIAPEVMPEMAKLLTQLEEQGDLEADILESTRIYKVLTLILKAEIPRDDEFSFSARVQTLVDDYELTLISANPNDKGYFASRPDISRNSSESLEV